MKKITCVITMLTPFLLVSARSEQAPMPDPDAVTRSVEAFHDALGRGDSSAALALLAPDAIILESGAAQTREEYAREHLAEDIAFVKAVPGTRSKLDVKQEGNVAWTTASTESVGKFNGRDLNSVGVELMVLTKSGSAWHIRAIHWSSHRR